MMTEESQRYLVKPKTKTYYEIEEEAKLADDINSKLCMSCPPGELASAANVTPVLTNLTKEESSLKDVLKLLKMEHSKLMLEESLTGSIIVGLKSQKLELDSCIAEEFAARGQFDGLITALREMLLETRDARKEEENEMRFTTNDLKKQAEAASGYLSQIGNEIRHALQETEEAKSSEARILDKVKTLSEKAIPSKDSTPESITIPEEEFEYLIQKIYKSETITDMKVAAARKQVEATKASEQKALKELHKRRMQIEDMRAILDLASKKEQAAEAAKKASMKQHKRDQHESKRNLIAPQVKIKEQYIAGVCLL